MPVPILAHRIRVECVYGIPRTDQPLDEQATVCLDPDDDRRRIGRVLGDELMDPARPVDAVGYPRVTERFPLSAEEPDVVVGLRPVDPNVDQALSSRNPGSNEPEKTRGGLMVE